MDLRFSPSDEAFRQEVREFLRKEWNPKGFDAHSLGVRSYDYDSAESRGNDKEFIKKLIAKGWYTMHWPREYGGQEVPLSWQLVYREEMAYAGAPEALGGGLVAPLLMIHGQDWQKQYFLPRIANNEIQFAQGFSEPNAGTDLASLQTRAVLDGDDFVVTGQKIWSSASHFADWYHVLVRTDPDAPKHRGISYLVMQLKDEHGNTMPGITLRPLYDFFGRRRWNEVFLDGARVPKRNLIGELNRGWYTAMTTLNFERVEIDGPAAHLGILDRFIALCRETRFNGQPVLDDPLVKHKLADLRITVEVDRMLAYRVAEMHARGEVPVKESHIAGYRDRLTAKFHLWPTLAKIISDYSVLLKGEGRAPHNGVYGTNNAASMTIGFGGGGGILLSPNIIAQRGLGLPR